MSDLEVTRAVTPRAIAELGASVGIGSGLILAVGASQG